MKKTIALLLAAIMIVALAACAPKAAAPTGEIIYGSSTQMSNLFSMDFPGGSNNAVNYDIARLTQQGLMTYEWTKDEVYMLNETVVKKLDITTNDDGSKTYAFELHNDLKLSDGTAVNAKNYVFSALLGACPQYGEIGAYNFAGDDLVGYQAFHDGEVNTFAGVRLLGDYKFSITISAAALPYYYESTLAAYGPAPIHVYAPDCTVEDTENGAKFSDNFTADIIRATIADETNGQLYKPTVFNGPYMLENYNPSDSSAVLVVNPNFKGSYDGNKPTIAKIIIKYTPQATRMDMLAAGEVQLLPGVNGEAIGQGRDIAEADGSKVAFTSYPRAGYGKINFRCDFGPTRFTAVRQAITFCLDRDEFCKQFTKGYGIVVDGYYGASMREYRENKAELESLLTHYTYNLETAKQLLIDDGWTLNASGGEYVEGSGEPRYKMVDGQLEPLVVKWFSTEGNAVSDLIATMLVPEAIKVGIKIEQTVGDFPTLQLNMQMRPEDGAEFHMFNLATGFGNVAAMWYYYGTNPEYMGQYNSNFIVDTELENLALELKATAPGDFASWSAKWVQFQDRWNELIPDVPLYSDEYHDFYPTNLTGYEPSPMWQWAYAIQRAKLT